MSGSDSIGTFSLEWQHRKDFDSYGFKIHQSLYIDEIIAPELLSSSPYTPPTSYVLEPQNLINIILKIKKFDSEQLEDIEMNADQMAFLFPKIEQYRKGIWIVEPCFIHPKYKGKISVHVCNLSRVPILINRKDALMEMVTFNLNSCNGKNIHKGNQNENYSEKRRAEALLFPKTFLDITENIKKIKDEVGIKPFQNMLILVLTIFTLIVGASGWINWNIGKDVRDAVVDQKELEDDDIRKEMLNYINTEVRQSEERILETIKKDRAE